MSKAFKSDAALTALYGKVPKMIGCDGRCKISCGPIDMSGLERQKLRDAGYDLPNPPPVDEHFTCPVLTAEGRCAEYELRPMICRVWGAVPALRCPFGCVPEGGYLTDAQAAELLQETKRIGGYEQPPPEKSPTGLWLNREMLSQWAGRPLTDAEVWRLAEALPSSGVPAAIAEIVRD